MAYTVYSSAFVVSYWHVPWRCHHYWHLRGQILSCTQKPNLRGYVSGAVL